ncbi:MAG: hypothetical protein JJT78_16955 [Leptospira sp.]|nr:hypothetical protein [Leptospira sp.]
MTWDGPGHWVQLAIFSDMGKEFLGEKYVLDWFGGYPAFRYYPGFYYFLGSIPIWLGVSIDTSFSFITVFSVILLVGGLLFWSKFYFPQKSYLVWSVLFLYAGFLGTFKMGVGITGILGGNYPHLLGVAFSFWTLGYLIRKKYNISAFFLSALAFTHYMGFLFTLIIVIFYFFIRKKKFKFLIFTIPLFLSIISFYGIIFYPHESSAEVQFAYFPLLETILGGFQQESFFEKLYFHSWQLIPLGGFLGIFSILYIRKKNLIVLLPLFLSLVLFLFFIQDISVGRMFPEIKVHLYRSWDLFYATFCLLGVIGLGQIFRKFTIVILILSAVFFIFSMQRIYEIKDIYSNKMDKFDLNIENVNNKLFVETSASGHWYLRPHSSLKLLKLKDIKSENGLMVESSWTPYVHRIYLPLEQENDFQWGFTSPRIREDLPPISINLVLDYLKLRGIEEIISKTSSFERNFQPILNLLSENKKSNQNWIPIAIPKRQNNQLFDNTNVTDFFHKSYKYLVQIQEGECEESLFSICSKDKKYHSKSYILLDTDYWEPIMNANCEWQNIPISYYPNLSTSFLDSKEPYYRTHANTIFGCVNGKIDLKEVALSPWVGYLKFLIYIGLFFGLVAIFAISLINKISFIGK